MSRMGVAWIKEERKERHKLHAKDGRRKTGLFGSLWVGRGGLKRGTRVQFENGFEKGQEPAGQEHDQKRGRGKERGAPWGVRGRGSGTEICGGEGCQRGVGGLG